MREEGRGQSETENGDRPTPGYFITRAALWVPAGLQGPIEEPYEMCLETVCPGGQKGDIYPLGSVPPLGKDTQKSPSGSAHQSAEWLTGVHRQDAENLRQKAEAPGPGKARWPHRVKPIAP